MMWLVILVSLSFLVWNILNETVVLEFFNTKNTALIKQWHLYDAVFRAIVIPYIVFYPLGINTVSIKLLICIGLFYHFGFNIIINYWRRRKEWNKFSIKEQIQILLYLSDGATIDKYIIRFAAWLSKQFSALFKKTITIDYRLINLIIIILEIFIIVWLWL